jgi:hypothetical protein
MDGVLIARRFLTPGDAGFRELLSEVWNDPAFHNGIMPGLGLSLQFSGHVWIVFFPGDGVELH